MKKAMHPRLFLLGCTVALCALVFAPSAFARASSSNFTTGYLEICKYPDPNGPVTGTFDYTVNGNINVSVAVNTCSAPFQVPSGQATVVETPTPFSAVTGISAIPAYNLISSNNASGTAVVNVPGGDISTTTTVNYTNIEVTGFIEVCKQAALGSGLTGSFQFTITGAMNFTQTVNVPVGACSNSIQVPAGQVQVQETGSPATYVTDIEAQPSSALISSDLTNASAQVAIAAGDVSTESIVTFTNNTSRLKICKVDGSSDGSLLGQLFTFTANGTSMTVPAGAPPGGTCVMDPVPYRAGTLVTVSEGINPGTQVSDIEVNPPNRIVGSADLTNRTVSVILGSGETDVTYTNVPAPPGTLKICKNAGPGVTTGSSWPFTVSGVSGTIMVPAGSCKIVGDFPFNSVQTVTEQHTSGFAVSAMAANPANRLVGTPNLSAGVMQLRIGTGVTQALVTDEAVATTSSGGGGGSTGSSNPPAPTSTPPTKTVTTPGGSNQSQQHVIKPPAATPEPIKVQKNRLLLHKLVKHNGHYYLQIKVSSASGKVHFRLVELGAHGAVIKTITMTAKANKQLLLAIPGSKKLRGLRVSLLS
jgi:hypothetical protein